MRRPQPQLSLSARPTGAGAVMASRGTPDSSLDYFPTPPWAARAGAELIRGLDPGSRGGSAWEPACGGGHMVHGLRDYWEHVRASDIHPYTDGQEVADFLDPDLSDAFGWDWIVTNPPFKAGEAFARLACARARRGVAMLLRLSWLEGASRWKLLYEDCPLYCVAPFAERVRMVAGRWDPKASSATAYAWFVWLSPLLTLPKLGEPPKAANELRPFLRSIPPGTRERLSRREDAEVFGVAVDTPLFG